MNDIKKSKLDIRNLNEFITVENTDSDVQILDIENLIYIYQFFNKIIDNKNITTDEMFIKLFIKEFNENKDILSYIKNYQSKYADIKRIYLEYEENPATTINKISNILKKSEIYFFKEEYSNLINFYISLDEENMKSKIENHLKPNLSEI